MTVAPDALYVLHFHKAQEHRIEIFGWNEEKEKRENEFSMAGWKDTILVEDQEGL